MQITRGLIFCLLLASNTVSYISAVEMKVKLHFRTIESPDVHSVELDESTAVPQIREEIAKVVGIPARLQKLIVRGVMIPVNSPRLAKDISEAGTVIVIRTSEEAIAAAEAAQKQDTARQVAPTATTPAAAGGVAPAGADGAAPVAGGNPQDLMGNLMGMAFGNNALVDLMNNPEIMGALQDMMSNPADFQAMISQNPMLQQLAQQNPQVNAMIQDPQLLNSLFRPEVMQQVQSFMGAFSGNTQNGNSTAPTENGQEQVSFGANGMPPFFPPGMAGRFPTNNGNQNNGNAPPFNPFMNPMMSQILQQQMSSGGANGDPFQNMGSFPPMQQGNMRFPFMQTFPSNVAPTVPNANQNSDVNNNNTSTNNNAIPSNNTSQATNDSTNTSNTVTLTEEELTVQMEVLKSMGFTDEAENRRILTESGGDVNTAVNRLLERRSM